MQDVAADRVQIGHRTDTVEDDREFVTTQACGNATDAGERRQTPRRLTDDEVGRMLAVNVIDVLEAVEIDLQNATRLPITQAGQQKLEALGKKGAVGQLGQRIVLREKTNAALRQLALAQVEETFHPHGLAAIDDVSPAALDRNMFSIRALDDHFATRAIAHGGGVLNRVGIAIEQKIEDRCADHLTARTSDQRRQLFIAIDDNTVTVDQDRLERRIGKRSHALALLAIDLQLGQVAAARFTSLQAVHEAIDHAGKLCRRPPRNSQPMPRLVMPIHDGRQCCLYLFDFLNGRHRNGTASGRSRTRASHQGTPVNNPGQNKSHPQDNGRLKSPGLGN